MSEQVNLVMLPKETEEWMKSIEKGDLAVARSNNKFLYIYFSSGEYQLFVHTPGLSSGGRRTMTRDEKCTAMVSNLSKVADSLYSVEFEGHMDIFAVMATAEEAILSSFPNRDSVNHEDIDFIIPGKTALGKKEGIDDYIRSGEKS